MVETVLIVDDEAAHLRMAEYVIQHKLRYRTVALTSGEEAVSWIMSGKHPVADLVLLDLIMPGMPGIEVIKAVKAWNPQLPVIVVTPYGDHEHVPAAIQAGANDFLAKPIVIDRLALSLQNALKIRRLSHYISRLERVTAGQASLGDILSDSPAVKQAVVMAGLAASSELPVWIEGEHGTGKELFARAIHGNGRTEQPFVTLDCGALKDRHPDSDIQVWFKEKYGEALNGTLFLKKINKLNMEAQQALLHMLEQMPRKTARIICSSSESIEYTVQQGYFSKLLHRQLKGLAISLPALRERKGDIGLLAEYFLMMAALAENKPVYGITPRALNWLQEQPWPDNIRQLSGVVRQAVVRAVQDTLDIGDFQPAKKESVCLNHAQQSTGEPIDSKLFLDGEGQLKKLKRIESEAIRFALQYSGGCMTQAAKSLGIGRSTLYRKMSELDEPHYISRANQTMRPII